MRMLRIRLKVYELELKDLIRLNEVTRKHTPKEHRQLASNLLPCLHK